MKILAVIVSAYAVTALVKGTAERKRCVDAHTAARYRNLRTEIDPIEIPDCADAFDRP